MASRDSNPLSVSLRINAREKQISQHNKAHVRKKKNKERQTIFAAPLDHLDDEAYETPSFPKPAEDLKFLDEALGENFIFSDLTEEERTMLIYAMQRETVAEGDVIIREGDVGDYFYVVESGQVAFVLGDGTHVGSCSRGGSFGELALLYDAPRAATCLAVTDEVQLWKVDQETFRHLLARQSQRKEHDITSLMTKIPLLKEMDRATASRFATALAPVQFTAGERIVNKGDVGDIFYIITSGQVQVHDIGLGDSRAVDQVLSDGDWFGERALMTGEPRAAHVTAMSDTVSALAIDRETLEKTIGNLESILGRESKKRFLKGVPIFANSEFTALEYDQLVDLLVEEKRKVNDKLAEAGKPVRSDKQKLWIVKEGKLMVTSTDGEIYFLGSGDYFGDKLLKTADGDESIASMSCVCDEPTTCWVLTRSAIEGVIGDVQRLGESIPFVSSSINPNIRLEDVKRHRILGVGAFGKVWLSSYSSDRTPYALKMVNKRQVIDANQVKGIMREKQIMSSIDHPFILGLISAFQDDEHLYFMLPLIQGGELFNVVHTEKYDGISNSASVFYAACVLEALGHLHERNIVYRDMKPENALIDARGYCILVDLGFAKIVVDKTYTLCGTPEYLAPEIIMSKGHNKAVDYWSLGVLVYEMLVGRSPFYFYGTDQVSLFKRIVMVKYSCPNDLVNTEAKDLIKKLLTRRQAARFGNLSRGHLDVRDHPWFDEMDFDALYRYEIPAPWVPTIKDPFDSSHFEDFSREEREKSHGGKPLSVDEQMLFKNF